MATIKWSGDRIIARMAAASAAGVDRTMGECVGGARREHGYDDETGFLTATTEILKPATVEGTKVSGTWGSTADYSLDVEIGTSRVGPTVEERKDAAAGNMWDVAAPQPEPGVTVEQPFTILPPGTMDGQEDFVTLHRPSMGEGPLMAQRPWLRPQADLQYPLLAARIGEAFRSGK